MWSEVAVGAQRPRHSARGPVLEGPHGEVGGLIPGCLRGGPAFGHDLVDVGVGVVEVGEDAPVVVGGVAVPGDGVDVLAGARDDGLRVVGLIGVVIVGPDFGAEAGALQRGADLVVDEFGRLVRVDVHGRVPGLGVEGFVLDGDGVDGGAGGGEGLGVLDEVLGVGVFVGVVEVVLVGGAADDAVELHPAGGRPDGAEEGEAALDAFDLGDELGHGAAAVG